MGIAAMASGDLNRDGLDDLVVSTWEGKLWVFLNHGRWGFQWASGSPYEVPAKRVFVYDHDGDRLPDVIAANGEGAFLLKNSWGGRLEEAEAIGGLAEGIMDGKPGTYSGHPGFFLLGLHGLWFLSEGELEAKKVLDEGGIGLAVADFDGDGLHDVAVAGRYGEVRVYPGNEDGLGEPLMLESQPRASIFQILSPDLNGDGWMDLVVVETGQAGLGVFYNELGKFSGPYWFGSSVLELGGFPPEAGVAVFGDFTGDEVDDIALSLELSHVAVFTTEERGRSLQRSPGTFPLGSADLNGDSFPDLLVNLPNGGIASMMNSGHGAFLEEELVEPSGRNRTPYIAKLADITGDGVDELVVFEFVWDGANITVWDLEAKEVLWSMPLRGEVRPLLVISDQTGDGIPDVVTGVGDEVVVLSHGPRWPKRVEIPWGGPVGPLVGVEIAGEKAVAGLRVGEKTELLLLVGGEIRDTGLELSLSPLDLIAVDLNGDGAEDLLSIGWGLKGEELAMVVCVMWGDGEGGFSPEYFPIPDWPPTAIPFPYGGFVAGDFDGDGGIDLAAMRLPDKGGTPGGIVILPWKGDGFGAPVLRSGCVGVKLLAADFDGDGRDEFATVTGELLPMLCLSSGGEP